ncbi:uncharacterized protein LOC108632736 [Ceratina calcarata]|uniref:Uncharacterized protein LOC108632736 n=1 Tax=Ceratina calcarata TaxID=156304 RepID=A0AAJ7JHM6_9HYME|nr:uncharacterized protein LOC108632736 [Ceratina calcarata]
MLIPIEKQSTQQLAKNSVILNCIKPVLSKSNEEPKGTNEHDRITAANKLLKDPKKDSVRSKSLKINKSNKQAPTCICKSLGVLKQKIQYFDMNTKNVQKGTERKKLTATNRGYTVPHNYSDVSEIGTSRITNKKEKESTGEEKKLIKENMSAKTVFMKAISPGKSTTASKTIRIVKHKKLPLDIITPTNSTSSAAEKSCIKLPTVKVLQDTKNDIRELLKIIKKPHISNKTIEPDQDVRSSNTTEKLNINSVKDLVSTVSEMKGIPEKNVEDKIISDENEDDVVILYEKRTEEPQLVPDVKNIDSGTNIINESTQNHTQHVNSSELITTVAQSVPQNNEKQTTHTTIPLKYDENIREIALLALAECGTKKMQQITKNCLEVPQYKEIQTQTDVFGLLDEGYFVSINEAMDGLERMKQKTLQQTENSSIAHEVQVQTDLEQANLQQQLRSSMNCNFDNMDMIFAWNSSPTPEIEDIHSYFKTTFNSNEEVDKVKKVLSIPQTFCKRVATQLEKDYEEMQSWDDDGFFNIHRAVMNDDFRRVKRLMVVLNASKTNIDIRTEDGLTSLELAVKYCSSESIVKLLLDAGAKPITSELLHESAVILASKSSSPLLPLLLDYVTESELLNQMDSTGFAPLHYCAMHGNMNGLTSLISKGVDVNVRDHRSGRTPFFHAVENNHMKIAQKLIQSGGIADIPNFSGQSVMSLVCEAKRFLLMPVLRDMIFQLPASKNRSNF